MVAFLFLAAMVLVSAWRVATTPSITHATLFLATTFAGVAGLFFLLQADFLAAVQLLIYAGAVMAVVIFAVMLSDMRDIEPVRGRGLAAQVASSQFGWLPLAGATVLFVLFMLVYVHAAPGWPKTPVAAAPDSTSYIAGALFGSYALPFEVASVLLLAAMIGAIILTRQEGGRRS
jgi:NADH:ubiquinone oxidoreductase subunit 6 (subunit J)